MNNNKFRQERIDEIDNDICRLEDNIEKRKGSWCGTPIIDAKERIKELKGIKKKLLNSMKREVKNVLQKNELFR